MHQGGPINRVKEAVVVDLGQPNFPRPQPLADCARQKCGDQRFALKGDMLGELQAPVDDVIHDFLPIVVSKWGLPGQHLVDKHAQGPEVGLFAVRLFAQHFRRHVLNRATEGGRAVVPLQAPREACVGYGWWAS
jgi:hypothetical protein